MWNNNRKPPILQYLSLTFLIAWGCEAVLILGERLEILTGTIGMVITFIIIGFGAGFAPASYGQSGICRFGLSKIQVSHQ